MCVVTLTKDEKKGIDGEKLNAKPSSLRKKFKERNYKQENSKLKFL